MKEKEFYCLDCKRRIIPLTPKRVRKRCFICTRLYDKERMRKYAKMRRKKANV